MKYGLLEYTTQNIGDEIQSIAARQFLPRVDTYLERDYLNQVDSDEDIKLIMNGWFSHNPENWPPSSRINPLFISFHIAEKAKEDYTSKQSISYLSAQEPIGCRDIQTRDLLVEHGVNAYFSGCLTLTLSNKNSHQNTDEVFFVDIDREIINSLPTDLRNQGEYLTHEYKSPRKEFGQKMDDTFNDAIEYARKFGVVSAYGSIMDLVEETFHPQESKKSDKFQRAQTYLDKYTQAKLVITSRLHVTLPCLAFGTPVILVHENPDDPRFDGLKEYINLYSKEEFMSIKESNLSAECIENPGDISRIQSQMRDTVTEFLRT